MTAGGTERMQRMRWSAPGEGEDVVGLPPLELPLRHEQGGPGVGAGEGLLLRVADHAVSCGHLCNQLGEGALEQLHVQLAQGYEPVVVQLSGGT